MQIDNQVILIRLFWLWKTQLTADVRIVST